jgi:hypothetical protein
MQKIVQKDGSSYHILCQCPVLAGCIMNIFCSAVVKAADIRRALLKQVLALVLKRGLFKRRPEVVPHGNTLDYASHASSQLYLKMLH